MALKLLRIKTAIGFLAAVLVIAPMGNASNGGEASRKRVAEHRDGRADGKGAPFSDALGNPVHSPEKIAELALLYGSNDNQASNKAMFISAVNWLERNFADNGGSRICVESAARIDQRPNVKAPRYGSYCQATGILAFIEAFKGTRNEKYLSLAQEAAKVFAAGINEKGLMSRINGAPWFEDPVYPGGEPSHKLRGHMRALVALKSLYDVTAEPAYMDLFTGGLKAAQERLHLYDSGYWLGDGLEKRKEVLLRFNNPYGFNIYPLAIEKIRLNDPVTGFSRILDFAVKVGFGVEIEGQGWQAPEKAGVNVFFRRLKEETPLSIAEEMSGSNRRPKGALVKVDLTGIPERSGPEPLYIEITYSDEAIANINLQIQSIAPGQLFRDLTGGELSVTGSGNKHRKWMIPVLPQQLGYFTDAGTEKTIAEDLEALCKTAQGGPICAWEKTVKNYIAGASLGIDDLKDLQIKPMGPAAVPEQTPFTEYLLNEEGIVLCRNKDGAFINPFEVARAAYDDKFIDILLSSLEKRGERNIPSKAVIKAKNLEYLKKTAGCTEEACVWTYGFNNSYNDVTTIAPWASAFAQSYVIEAFLRNEAKTARAELMNYAKKAANAFRVPTSKGGLLSSSKEGMPWFEEVPNDTHILNAHIVSSNILYELGKESGLDEFTAMHKNGAESLSRTIQKFDNGYWTRYDLNPKKELMFQIDWISGASAPLIDEICVADPLSGKECVNVGKQGDFDENVNRISGTDWGQSVEIEGRTARTFQNGYMKRDKAANGGALHNVFFFVGLPEKKKSDFFDIQDHYLFIRYKDTGEGQFIVKIRSIREGNFLEFMPLYGGYIKTTGDNKWNYAVIRLRPQDLGWYVGPDYQKYHVEQLEKLAGRSGSPILAQYAEKWKYYLDSYTSGRSPVDEPMRVVYSKVEDLSVVPRFELYSGHGFENALDGDGNDDYVAAMEGQNLPYEFEINIPAVKKVSSILLAWESSANSGSDFTIDGYHGAKKVVRKKVKGNTDQASRINLGGKPVDRLVITVSSFNGQQRFLLRQLELLSED